MARSKETQFIINTNRWLGKFWELLLELYYHRFFKRLYKKAKVQFPEQHFTQKEITAYKKRWKPLGYAHPIYYKMYSNYIGRNIDILPDDLSHRTIESILNPVKFRAPFEDKNMFDKIVGSEMTPITFLRSMGGFLYMADYTPSNIINDNSLFELISSQKRIVVKTTLESCSGDDVIIFEKDMNGIWRRMDESKTTLSLHLLNKRLGKDWIIQEYLYQSEFMSSFCKTSVNTLRILVYRSVKDDNVHVLNSGMRIGHDGSFLDNSHQGGLFVGIDKNGKLNNYLTDQYRIKYTKHNNIDFSSQTFIFPNWENVKEFAREIGRRIQYHRCLNLDVMIDSEGKPKLIEFNIGTMSMGLFQSHNGPCFGKYTDEIIEYCTLHKDDLMSKYLYV